MDKYTIGSGVALLICLIMAGVLYLGGRTLATETCRAQSLERAIRNAKQRPTQRQRAAARYAIENGGVFPDYMISEKAMDEIYKGDPLNVIPHPEKVLNSPRER